MYENVAIHKNALEIDFNHHHYIMTDLFKCFNFQWQVPPEKLSCTYVCIINIKLYNRRSYAFQVCKAPVYLKYVWRPTVQ